MRQIVPITPRAIRPRKSRLRLKKLFTPEN
jgi:hypothetical protein